MSPNGSVEPLSPRQVKSEYSCTSPPRGFVRRPGACSEDVGFFGLLSLQSELLEIFVIFDVRVHSLPDDFRTFCAVLFGPLSIFVLGTFGLLFLPASMLAVHHKVSSSSTHDPQREKYRRSEGS